MRLIAKVIRISHAKFHCSRLTTVTTRYSRLRESYFLALVVNVETFVILLVSVALN